MSKPRPGESSQYEPLAAGFLKNTKKFPDKNALHVNETYYTYSDLLKKSEIIFSQLHGRNIPPFIGIYCQESAWTYAAIIAVSLSGACYVPLNSRMPAQKLQSLVKQCGLQLIISETTPSFTFDAELMLIKTGNEPATIHQLVNQDIAYLLFTSGTTGSPKGVPVSNGNLNAFFNHFEENFDFNSADRFLQPYELSFDVSVFSIFAAWNCGACVYVVREKGIKYLNIINTIKKFNITVCSMVPSVLQYLEKYFPEISLPSVRYSFFSGDKLFHHLASQWKKSANNSEVYNCYGPTETTIVCTSYKWSEDLSTRESVNNIVPIGKLFNGMKYILIDIDGNIINEGIGELCLSGPQVISAYLGGTNEIAFFDKDGSRFYKTGDLASVNANGNLLFHGRLDSQFKINGYRVEAAEIENAIYRLLNIDAVVMCFEINHINRLVAFTDKPVDRDNLNSLLSGELPDFMIPSEIRVIKEFPYSLNGKIDKNVLKKIYNEPRSIAG
jgi:D-alanine--poly(phosphoribitol) ligase subunit 1